MENSIFSDSEIKRFKYLRQMQLYYEREAKRLEQEIHELEEENALAKYILEEVKNSKQLTFTS